MNRAIASMLLIAAAALTGCHAPKPSFNLLAPYGSPRVPPPPTSGIGGRPTIPGNPAVPPTTVPSGSSEPQAGAASAPSAQQPAVPSNQAWTSVQERGGALKANSAGTVTRVEGDVRLASFTESPPAAAESRSQQGNDSLRLEGMPVNEATRSAAAAATDDSPPGLLRPAAEATPISHLPPPPTEAVPAPTVTATAKSSDAAQPAQGKSTLQWKSRQ